ncbi:MAG TPA: septation protein A [Casimicrobiaceae bacterium]|jgi:intracellular septation protein
MQFLADYFPLILFFVAFKLQGIFVATGVAIAASIAQIAYFRWHRGKVAAVHWISFAIIAIFGGATLLLHDETFIKWKPTVLYWLFALVLATGRIAFRKNLLSALLKDLTLPDPVWSRLTWAWVVFLAAMGLANLYVAFSLAPAVCGTADCATNVWVNFKVWGGIGLFMLAAVGTVASVARYLPGES